MKTFIIIGFLSVALLLTGCSAAPSDNSSASPDNFKSLIANLDTAHLKIGPVPLSQNQQYLTVDGNMHVVEHTGKQTIIIFKTWVGKGMNMRGFLYASVPLTSGDFSKDYYGNDVVTVTLTTPYQPGGTVDLQLPIEMTTDPHWYQVAYSLD